MNRKKKACLITGGAGFLGSQYCKFLAKKNFTIFFVDNNKKNLAKIKSLGISNLITYECDISNYKMVEKLYKDISKSYFVNALINNVAIDAIPFKKKRNF